MTTQLLSRSVRLDRGDVLRIRDGRGVTLRPSSGVLWVTEERSRDDRVVTPGFSCRLEGGGLALAYAHQASSVVLEVQAGAGALPDVRVAAEGADASRAIRFRIPRGAIAKLAARVSALWQRWRRSRERAARATVPVGGYAEHDRFLSSRRRRGTADRSPRPACDAMTSRAFLPY
jgi:hypothetical protein